jgi:hypothetical protein
VSPPEDSCFCRIFRLHNSLKQINIKNVFKKKASKFCFQLRNLKKSIFISDPGLSGSASEMIYTDPDPAKSFCSVPIRIPDCTSNAVPSYGNNCLILSSNLGLQVGEKVQRVQHEQPLDLPGRDQADHGREQPRHGDYRQSQGSR